MRRKKVEYQCYKGFLRIFLKLTLKYINKLFKQINCKFEVYIHIWTPLYFNILANIPAEVAAFK
jgi:hypothetical protein